MILNGNRINNWCKVHHNAIYICKALDDILTYLSADIIGNLNRRLLTESY
jgi:hypothetical protein